MAFINEGVEAVNNLAQEVMQNADQYIGRVVA